jgi:hypothetical protein
MDTAKSTDHSKIRYGTRCDAQHGWRAHVSVLVIRALLELRWPTKAIPEGLSTTPTLDVLGRHETWCMTALCPGVLVKVALLAASGAKAQRKKGDMPRAEALVYVIPPFPPVAVVRSLPSIALLLLQRLHPPTS